MSVKKLNKFVKAKLKLVLILTLPFEQHSTRTKRMTSSGAAQWPERLGVGVRLVLTLAVCSLLAVGVHDYLTNMEANECSMTYMRQSPSLLPVALPGAVRAKYPNYALYLYCEGNDCQLHEHMRFSGAGGLIPVLFVPGNADSAKQVRSMASVGLDKSRTHHSHQPPSVTFLYFTISFNEELSALYGPLLDMQTRYVRLCVKHILGLFGGVRPLERRPTSVLLIGNSMGGMVARAIFVPHDKQQQQQQQQRVHTIITKSTPHRRPVLNVDAHMNTFYARTNAHWLNTSASVSSLDNVLLASLYGGKRDVLVRSGLANLNTDDDEGEDEDDEWSHGKSRATILSAYTGAMPRVWRSIDHRCMAWCLELVLALNRALFEMVDPRTLQITDDRAKRARILRFHLQRGIPDSPAAANDDHDERHLLLSNARVLDQLQAIEESLESELNAAGGEQLKERAWLVDLSVMMEAYDSLFVLTSVPSSEPNVFSICKGLQFDQSPSKKHKI